jgi:hypothetical protein
MTVISLAGDPVWAATRNYIAAANALDDFGFDGSDEFYEIEQSFFDAQPEWWHTVPTTPEGVKTKIAHAGVGVRCHR